MKLHAVCLLLSLTLAGAAPAAPTSEDAKIDWTALLQQYRRYGLPLPPPDAHLVQVWAFSGFRNGEPPGEYHCLAFSLQPGLEKARLLVGTEEYQPNGERKVTAVDPVMLSLDHVTSAWSDPVFEVNAGVATAIQCRDRGWNDLAERLLAKSLGESSGHRFSIFYQPGHEPAPLTLARVAWSHYANELIRPDSDRSALAQQMEIVLRETPELRNEGSRVLLQSVQAALQPSQAPPGSPEAAVDALVDLPYHQHGRWDDPPDPHYLRVAELGFAAIPALIEHLDDERLTRTVRTGFNNFPTYHQTVGMVASELLQHLAGTDLGKDWLQRQQGWNVEKQVASAWWERARTKGEELYFAEHVLPPLPKDGFPDADILRILTERYPQRLPHLYRIILRERPQVQSWPVAEAITRSSLTPLQKLRLFREGAVNRRSQHRYPALRALRPIDPDGYVRLTVRLLDTQSPVATGPYAECLEAANVSLVSATDDSRAWAALQRALQRSNAALRLEMLSRIRFRDLDDGQRRRRLELLARYLSDSGIRLKRDDLLNFYGGYAAPGFDRLEVRNFVAMKLGPLLRVDGRPQPTWTDAQWTEFRERVKQALAHELPAP